MSLLRVPFTHIKALSSFDRLYSDDPNRLSPYLNYMPNQQGLLDAIDNRKTQDVNRSLLVEVISDQYKHLNRYEAHRLKIDSLLDNSVFTITTAHQLNIFTGPLYYIYKILTTIKLSRLLSTQTTHTIVPVFVMGGEDHDFEEINHAQIYAHRLTWQRPIEGSVGRMSTEGISHVLNELYNILGETATKKIKYLFDQSYMAYPIYGMSAQRLVIDLFKDTELLVLNMDEARLKAAFAPIIKEELLQQTTRSIVDRTADSIEEDGFKVQVRPRDINLFMHGDRSRSRITLDGDHFKLADTSTTLTKEEILDLVDTKPEAFSPNVVMRPLYQELILPNICFVGGGGELAYWIELKQLFLHHNLHFPVLLRRASVLYVDKNIRKRIDKLELPIHVFFNDVDTIIRQYVDLKSVVSLELHDEQSHLDELFKLLKDKAVKVDQTLVKSLDAEHTKWNKSLAQLHSRLVRAEKKNNEQALNQIRTIKEKLFPNNGLQERSDNFLAAIR